MLLVFDYWCGEYVMAHMLLSAGGRHKEIIIIGDIE